MTPQTLRELMHRNPELSFQEHETQALIMKALEEEGIPCRSIAGTGVLAWLSDGSRKKSAVVLRADIDALPIQEETGAEFASQRAGVMHACGHDMHAAALFGALQRLKHEGGFTGTVFGLFQPGEECNPGGASLVLKEDPFKGYQVKAVIGEHVDTSLNISEVGLIDGPFMAASDELRFRVRGKGGHAAMRSRITDTVTAAAHLTVMLNTVNSAETVLSIGRVQADGATNVIPNEVYLEGTLRNFSEERRKFAHSLIEAYARDVDSRFGTQTEVEINHGYPCVMNDKHLTMDVFLAAAEFDIGCVVMDRMYTAEDFGFYTQRYPSVFFRLGVGRDCGKSHTSTFLPDSKALDYGVQMLTELAKRI